jgi:single-stranded-DNA-specific exonuclease
MSLGIECLLADDAAVAQRMAQQLHELNMERRNIEADMHDAALASLEQIEVADRYSLSLYKENWHQGVIGILASRIKERYYRPVIAFASAGDGLLKGSGRSISGLHLRDALDIVSKRKPDILVRFGGHAMAAGLTIREADFEDFVALFEAVVRELLSPADLESLIETDGELDSGDIHWDIACAIERQVWGQGFPLPLFSDQFRIVDQRIVGERHLKLVLEKQGRRFDGIFFQQQEYLPAEVQAVYQLQTNQYNGVQAVQLSLRHWQPIT